MADHVRSNPVQDETGESSSQWVDRPMYPAMLLSALSHIILILMLSLIALGSGSLNRPADLLVSQLDEFSFDVNTTVEFEPEPLTVPEESFELDAELEIPVEIEKPERLEIAVKPGNTDPVASEPSSSEEAVANTISAPVSRVAISIQKRVSDAGGRKGEVQFALAWKNVNDVDLHVVTPSGERISHLHKRSARGGMLDVDMNVSGESEEPVENVRWITGAPAGRYTVMINLFRIHRPKSGNRVYRGSEFQLLAQLGPESILRKEIVSRNKQVAIFRFQYVPANVPGPLRAKMLSELDILQEKEELASERFLQNAVDIKNQRQRDRVLNQIIVQYPHTDAAIEAMRMIGGSITKSGF